MSNYYFILFGGDRQFKSLYKTISICYAINCVSFEHIYQSSIILIKVTAIAISKCRHMLNQFSSQIVLLLDLIFKDTFDHHKSIIISMIVTHRYVILK